MWWLDIDDPKCGFEVGFLSGVCFLAVAEVAIGLMFWMIF